MTYRQDFRLVTENGRYLRAHSTRLDAEGTAPGNEETFTIRQGVTNTTSLTSGDPIKIQSPVGFFVSRYLFGSGLYALALDNRYGSFSIHHADGSSDGQISDGQQVALKANPLFGGGNGKWVAAEGGGGGEVNANRDSIGSWETFTIELLPRNQNHYFFVRRISCDVQTDATGRDEPYIYITAGAGEFGPLLAVIDIEERSPNEGIGEGEYFDINQYCACRRAGDSSEAAPVRISLFERDDPLTGDDKLGIVVYTPIANATVLSPNNLYSAPKVLTFAGDAWKYHLDVSSPA